MSTSQRSLYCLVSASAGVPLRPHLQILRRFGASPLAATSASLGSGSASEAIKRNLRETDFFVAVIGSQASSTSVFVELGFALALGIPTIVCADIESELPLVVQEAIVIRGTPGHFGGFEMAVEQLTSMIREAKGLDFVVPHDEAPHPEVGPPAFPLIDWENEQAALAALANLLANQPRLRTTLSKQIPGRTADLAVWSEDLGGVTGNPILVDVKVAATTRMALLNQIDRFANAIRVSSAPLGVLVLTTNPDFLPEVTSILPEEVLVVPAEDLFRNVATLGWAPFILHLQNTRYLFDDG